VNAIVAVCVVGMDYHSSQCCRDWCWHWTADWCSLLTAHHCLQDSKVSHILHC